MSSDDLWYRRRDPPIKKRKGDVRTPVQRDRARIYHSSAFRRLQDKTQVIGSRDSDFFRTRLTHSLEVAQIGVGIILKLMDVYKNNKKYLDYLPRKSLIETICLAHDIGHPPYGHGGEIALNYKMYKNGGFEGNAQTIRIVGIIDNYTEKHGMNLTRRAMLGLLKYPVKYSTVVSQFQLNPELDVENKIISKAWEPPKCYYDKDSDIIDWILDPLSNSDRDEFTKVENKLGDKEHNKSKYKSFDASIMELADDIAYGVHDLEDAITLGLISREDWENDIVSKIKKGKYDWINEKIIDITNKLFSEKAWDVKYATGCIINWLINNIEIVENNNFECQYVRFFAKFKPPCQEVVKMLKDFHYNRIISNHKIQQLQYSGQKIIFDLFDAFSFNPNDLLPEPIKSLWVTEKSTGRKQEMRIISDFISSMTNLSAEKAYNTLYVPNKGSIFQPPDF